MNRRGFTIIELLISISIFVFLTTVTVFAFRGAGFANTVRSSGAFLSSALRQAQAYAISGNAVSICSDYTTATPRLCTVDTDCGGALTCDSVVPVGGYGLIVPSANATSFSIFADLKNYGTYAAADDIIVNAGTVTLPDKTYIKNAGTVVFGTLRGKVTFSPVGGNGVPQDNTEHFCVAHPSFTNVFRKIIVNGVTGLIDDTSVQTCT